MRYLLFVPIITFVLSCTGSDYKTAKQPPPHSSDTIIVDKEKVSWIGNQKHLEQLRTEHGYSVQGLTLCDDSKGKMLDDWKLERYGYYNPYAIKKTAKQDSIQVSFDFISNCCLQYTGDINRKEDTLYLSYFLKEGEQVACDCSCDFRMVFTIKKQETPWKAIILRQG